MNFSPSFPPADALLSYLQGVNYRKHYNSFMDSVENLCIIVAAICIILARKWREHRVTERMQTLAGFIVAGLAILSEFVMETVWPIVKQMSQNVWRILYTIAQPPLTV